MMAPLQEAIFELICEIDDICRKNNITYYLHAGSVIGAIRHHGIIPWDDDIDIAITRSNWEKLKPLLKNTSIKNRELVTPEEYDDYIFTYPQYKNTATAILVKSGAFYTYPMGVIVDILIMDPVKGSERFIEKHKERLKLLSELRCSRFVLNRSTNWLKYNICKLFEKIIGRERILYYLEKKLECISEDKCDGYIQRVGIYPVFWDKKFFSEPEYVEMYGRMFPVPSHTEEYLRYTYGDGWMKYPSDYKKLLKDGSHGFKYDLNYSFDSIQNDFKPFIDEKRYMHEWERYKYWRAKAVLPENNVRISNSKHMAEISACAINEKLKKIDLEFAFKQNQYRKLKEWFDDYFRVQLSRRFLKDEIAVPVKDEIFYYACKTLILGGEYEKAEQIIICNKSVVRNEMIYSKLEEIIEITKELSIAIYEEKWNWDSIQHLVDIALPKYPHHVDFVAAKCLLMMHNKGKSCAWRVIDICKEELIYHPDCDILLKGLADAKMMVGQKAEAIYTYKKIYNNTANGMLRLDLEGLFKQNKISIPECLSEETDNETDLYELEKEEKLRYESNKLLAELDDICNKEKIPYFLGGSLAAFALNLADRSKEISYYIIMRPNDRKRFIQAVKKHMPINRVLESFENSKNYPDFSIRYCDLNSVDFDLRTKGFYKANGINITIHFVRPIDKRKYFRTLKRMFHTTIESLAYPSPFNCSSKRKVLASCMGRILSVIIGKKTIKRISWRLLFNPNNNEFKIKGRIKEFWSKSVKLPSLNFSKCTYCDLDNKKYPIPINYIKYINMQQSINGLPLVGKTTTKLPHEVQFNVSCEEVVKRFKALKLNRKYFRANKKMHKFNKFFRMETSYLNYAWHVMLKSIDRFKMYKQYEPVKNKILLYYKKGKIAKLEELLTDYIEAIERNDKRGMALIFDFEIFNITCQILNKQGKRALVERLKKRALKKDLKQMPYICGKVVSMKKARYKDKKRILKYLERDIENCLYMYADICKYGVKSKNITIWYDTDDIGIRMVVMKYHENFQVYTNRGFNYIDGLVKLVHIEKPHGILGRKEIILNLKETLKGEYKSEFGVIFRGKALNLDKIKRRLEDCDINIELAKESDSCQIASLICMDEELNSVYTEESMSAELRDRMHTKMGRSYIIRNGDSIVAHNATYAECNKFVIVSGLIVHPDFRNTEYAYWLDLKSSVEFQEEGKDRYFFALDKRIIHWHKTLNTPIVGEYGKLSLLDKK